MHGKKRLACKTNPWAAPSDLDGLHPYVVHIIDQFPLCLYFQVYARLNHVGVCLSYTGTLKKITQISEQEQVPIQTWLENMKPLKFVGDNVDTHRSVRDHRIDHHGKLVHMYSLLAVQGRVSSSDQSTTPTDLSLIPTSAFLPTKDDVQAIKLNLTIQVARILSTYIECLAPLKKVVPAHILHKYSEEMSKKSTTYFLDVLMKNECKHEDMIQIMKEQQKYLGDKFDGKVLSGGDQVTCERQACSQRHLICGNSSRERLQLLEPQTEDWHALMCFLHVRYIYAHACMHTYIIHNCNTYFNICKSYACNPD